MASRADCRLGMLFVAAMAGCPRPAPTPTAPTDTGGTDTAPTVVDEDHDGYSPPEDCDDRVSSIHPGAAGIPCLGTDFDCDGRADGDEDWDSDGRTHCALDCDDADPARVGPGEPDPIDGVDQDCDGTDGRGLVPTLFLEGTVGRGHFMGMELASGDVDGDGCQDLLVTEAGFTWIPPWGGGGGNSPAYVRAVMGCESVPPQRSYFQQSANGIGGTIHLWPYEGRDRVLALGKFNELNRGDLHVVDYSTTQALRVGRLEGIGSGDMADFAVLNRAGGHQVVINHRDSSSDGPLRVWSLPLPEQPDFAAPDAIWWDAVPDLLGSKLLAFDRDGDGEDELVANNADADSPGGAVRFWSGPGGIELAEEVWLGDPGDGSGFGTELYAAHDFPDPGDRSVLAGAISALGTGALHVLPALGPGTYTLDDAGPLFHGEFAGEWFGFSAGVGDVNGDGIADVAIGAPMFLEDLRTGPPGKVYVFLGPIHERVLTREQASYVFVGTQRNELFGFSLELADLDRNDVQEIYVGAPRHDTPSADPEEFESAGAVYRLDL